MWPSHFRLLSASADETALHSLVYVQDTQNVQVSPSASQAEEGELHVMDFLI